MIRQIADDTTKRRAAGQNDFGVLEYFVLRNRRRSNMPGLQTYNLMKITFVRNCFTIENNIARIVLMCGNPNDATEGRPDFLDQYRTVAGSFALLRLPRNVRLAGQLRKRH